MSFFDELLNKVRASYPCIYVTAREDWRAVQEIQKVAAAAQFKTGAWTVSRGWTYPEKSAKDMPALGTQDPMEVMKVDACGRLESGWEKFPYRVKVPAFANSFGRVPAWFAYACSRECRDQVAANIAADQAAMREMGAVR